MNLNTGSIRVITIPLRFNRVAVVALTLVMAVFLPEVVRAADCVTTSDAVVNGVTLRAQPSSNNAPRGTLKKGESLPLVSSMPRWVEMRLANGDSAFASKSWTNIVSCPAAPAVSLTTPAPMGTTGAAGTGYELHAIDVGTGLSVLVRGPDFTLLYDAGSNDDLALGPGNRTMAYLKTLSPPVTKIDHVILSHPHRDHVELLPDVINAFKPHEVWNSGAYNNICGYRNFLFAVAADTGVDYHTATVDEGNEAVPIAKATCYGVDQPDQTLMLKHGKRIGHDPIALGQGATMTILYSDGSPHASFNENSLVVRLDLGTRRMLLMGDAEAGGRQLSTVAPTTTSIKGILLACCAADIKADVQIVGHHGSKTSSRKAFIDQVGAHVFVISAGPTKYASVVLPDAEVVDELAALGPTFRTDLNDDTCGESASKVGPDNDGKAGGCDNVLLTIAPAGVVGADYRSVSD